jgi:lambda family phage tail tape measure protein
MSDQVKDLRFRVLAQVLGASAIKELDGEIKKVAKTAVSTKNNFESLASGAKALAGAFIVQQTISFSKGLIDMGDELQALHEKTGVAVEDLAGFKVAAETGNIGIDSLTKYLAKLSLGIAEASTGNKEFVADFKAVGVAFNDQNGKIRGTGDVVKDLADKFSTMEDGPAKAALAIKIFGKSGAEMIPFLNQGREELEKFSGAFDGDFAKRADQFNDSLTVMKKNLQGLGVEGLKEVLPTLQEIVNTLNKAPKGGELTFFRAVGEGIRIAAIGFTTFFEISKNMVDRVITLMKLAVNEISGFFSQVGDGVATRAKQLKALATLNFTEADKLGEEFEKRSVERGKATTKEREKLQADFLERQKGRAQEIARVYGELSKNSLLLGKGSQDDISKRQKDGTEPSGNRKRQAADLNEIAKNRKVERDRVKEFIEQQEIENKQRRDALGDINLTVLELRKVTEARKLDAEAIKTSKTMTAEQRKELMSATEEIKKQREAVIDLEYQQKRTFTYGAREYLRDYLDQVTNNANQIKAVFATTFSSLEDTMVDFLKTGKLNFRKFADDVINELLRIAVRQAVIAPIAGALSSALASGASGSSGSSSELGSSTYSSASSSSQFKFANGGVMTSRGAIPLRKYSSGGIANSPQMALYGEGRQPEAYVPLPDGRSIPVTMRGAGAGGDVNVSVQVNVTKDGGADSSAKSNSDIGKGVGNLIANAVKQEIINQKRPGGLLA